MLRGFRMTIKKSMTDFVEKLDYDTRAEVIYRHLVLGQSTRKIEREVFNKAGNGWDPWNVQKVYGYDKNTKGIKKHEANNENIKSEILNEIKNIDIKRLAEEVGKVDVSDINIPPDVILENDGKEILKLGKVRIGQMKWRKRLLDIYNHKCALCEVSHDKLLIASHIKSWSESTKSERVNVDNGIILCALHDKLFDQGFISFSNDYKVLYSKKFDFDSIGIDRTLEFRKPNLNNSPKDIYLSQHRKKFKF